MFHELSGFCGNGVIEKELRGEECDDGNRHNGDGCDADCRIESVFNCELEPSLCYRYDRDGEYILSKCQFKKCQFKKLFD